MTGDDNDNVKEGALILLVNNHKMMNNNIGGFSLFQNNTGNTNEH